jgi:hypothetical protein
MVGFSKPVLLSNYARAMEALQPQKSEDIWFGLYPFRSPLLGVSQLISFPLGTEMFHFPRFALTHLFIQHVVTKVTFS